MIERFGDDALNQVNVRIEELQEHGDQAAKKMWIEIRSVVESMAREPNTKIRH